MLSPLGLQSASAGHHAKPQTDLCKTFCKCRNKKQQDQCLKVCSACGKDPSRLSGSCGSYFCCSAGLSSCGSYCTNLASDPYNCGDCGYVCRQPDPNEYGACINGNCEYRCIEGAVRCSDGTCTFLGWDPDNCGACGNICPNTAPYCNQGECTGCPPGTALCGGQCVNLLSDSLNCGACGNVCGGPNPSCYQGACSHCTGYCPEGWCGGDGCGGECGCPNGTYCESNWCYSICAPGETWCDPNCVDLSSDPYNCGACYYQCAPNEVCAGGFCQGF